MLASLGGAPLDDPGFVYEPKYDGIRAIVEIAARGKQVTLWSRLGNDKTRQFPEIAGALEKWARRRTEPVVLDGEIVALDSHGDPTGFQQLQGRIHLTSADAPGPPDPSRSSRSICCEKGSVDFRGRPLVERREALEATVRAHRLADPAASAKSRAATAGRCTSARWRAAGKVSSRSWRRRGTISGKRTPDWRKLKIVHEQEFVVGGWTEPRQLPAVFRRAAARRLRRRHARLCGSRRHRLRRQANWRG